MCVWGWEQSPEVSIDSPIPNQIALERERDRKLELEGERERSDGDGREEETYIYIHRDRQRERVCEGFGGATVELKKKGKI